MKIIVTGPRDYTNYKFVELKIAMIWSMYKKNASNIEIVEGGAKGVDSLAKQVALTHKLSLKEFPADWNKYGHSAGPIRNSQMADYGDILIAFRYINNPSKGTESMIKIALKKGLEVHIVPIERKN